MNQQQRNFLIEKIKANVKTKIEALRDSIPEAPSVSNYLFNAVMSGNFELQSTESLKEIIKKKALNAKEGSNWLSEERMGWEKNITVKLRTEELFVIPEDYKEVYDDYKKKKNSIEKEIQDLNIQSDTLITRIQLASDKTLQKMIDEVDDMGNISLMDTKLKALTA